MYSLNASHWKFKSMDDNYISFINREDNSEMKISIVKFYNPKINGAAIFDNGRINLTRYTRETHPEMCLDEFLEASKV